MKLDDEYKAVVNSGIDALSTEPMEEEEDTMPFKLSEAERHANKMRNQAKYNKAKTTLITVRLNHGTDEDLLAYLSAVPNKQGLIKSLLRKSMEESGPNEFIVQKEDDPI